MGVNSINNTSFKFNGSLPQGTVCMFKMNMLSGAGIVCMDNIILAKII